MLNLEPYASFGIHYAISTCHRITARQSMEKNYIAHVEHIHHLGNPCKEKVIELITEGYMYVRIGA